MFFVYELTTGELVYTADAEAVQHLDAERYGWAELDAQSDWSQTHFWNRHNLNLEPLPTE